MAEKPRSAKDYQAQYEKRLDAFMEGVQTAGLPFESPEAARERQRQTDALRRRLEAAGAVVRNSGHSVVLGGNGALSPACEACATGAGSTTYYLSLACHRRCFFCFNPNQVNYEAHRTTRRDAVRELEQAARAGADLRTIALTGGEPLLFSQEAVRFFATARKLFPDAHLRLYTAGDQATEPVLDALAQAGLDEIRFSVKTDDTPEALACQKKTIALARPRIPRVMVEMPVIPGEQAFMERLLGELDACGVDAVNLLELCFPLHNAKAFRARGLQLKRPPYHILARWEYGGGLPVAESEREALALMMFAQDAELGIGLHYCSLENKLTAEVFRKNSPVRHEAPSYLQFSPHDYYFHSLKAFGRDAQSAQRRFEAREESRWHRNDEWGFIEFHPEAARWLPDDNAVLLRSYQIARPEGSGFAFEEVHVEAVPEEKRAAS